METALGNSKKNVDTARGRESGDGARPRRRGRSCSVFRLRSEQIDARPNCDNNLFGVD